MYEIGFINSCLGHAMTLYVYSVMYLNIDILQDDLTNKYKD